MLLRSIFDEEEYYVLFSMIEACYAIIIIIYDQFMLVRQRVSNGKLEFVFYDGRQDVTPVRTGKSLLNRLRVYPCR